MFTLPERRSALDTSDQRGPLASAFAVLLLGALFFVVEFGWKYAGAVADMKWPLSVPLWLVAIAVAVTPRRTAVLARRPLLLPFFGWLAWNQVAVLWADKIPMSQVVTLSMLATGLYAAWFAASFGWDHFCQVVVVVGAAFEALSLAAHALHYPHGVEGRMIGIGWGYSDTGIVAAFTTVIAVGLYRHRPRVVWPLGALGLATLLFAQARMSTVAAAVGVSLILIHGSRRSFSLGLRIAMVTVLSLGAVTVLGDSVLSSVVTRSSSGTDASSFTGRSLVWDATIDQIAKTPLQGIGSKDNEGFFIAAAGRGEIQIPIFHAHNALLETTLETGLIGGALLVASFAAYGYGMVRCRRRIARRPGRDGCIAVFLFLGVTEALVAQGTLAVLVLGAGLASMSTDIARLRPTVADPKSPSTAQPPTAALQGAQLG